MKREYPTSEERIPHCIRLTANQQKLEQFGITFGITIMEDHCNRGSFRIVAWYQDNEDPYHPMYESKEFSGPSISEPVSWLDEEIFKLTIHKLESKIEEAKQADKWLNDIEDNVNGGFFL